MRISDWSSDVCSSDLGVALRPIDGYLFQIVAPILTASAAARQLFLDRAGRLLGPGAMLRQPALADSLEALAREGADLFYRGEMADRLARLCRGSGGQLDRDDLAGYRVIRRRPLVCEYRGHRVVTNPPPSCGGLLIAFALALLGEVAPDELACGSPARLLQLARTMRLTNQRSEEHTSELQSLMRISYAVFCLKKKNKTNQTNARLPKNNRE